MRAGWASALAACVLLLAPSAGALLAADDAPEGSCSEREGVQACAWTFSDRDVEDARLNATDPFLFDLPVYPATLATFEIELVGKDNGWAAAVESQASDGSWSLVSWSSHVAPPANDPSYLSYRHKQTSTTVIFGDGLPHRLKLYPFFKETNDPLAGGPRSGGDWSVVYNGELVPPGVAPFRAAADIAHPQLDDITGDGGGESRDILRGWLTDDRLGDELLEVHLQVASLREISFTNALGLEADKIGWKLAWRLQDTTYFVEWIAEPVSGESGVGFRCELRSEVPEGNAEQEPVLAVPACDFDTVNGLLHATFPERTIGSPRDRELFEDLAARTRLYFTGQANPDVVDDTQAPNYLFALGGPAVWAELDGGALGPASAPWYRAPFAEENIVDSFQIFASILAAITFLVGLALVAKRKRRTNALLHRIDDAIHGDVDSRETLLRLGRLESDFSEMYRRGRLTEGQYQVLSQRIATVATRHSLRHSLGLDDGVPGDETPVRIDVAEGPKKRIRP